MIYKLWVLGAKTGGIGDAIVDAANGRLAYDEVVATGKEVDVRSPGQVDAFVKANGPFSSVVYSVGINQLALINDITVPQYLDMFNVNVVGFSNVLQALVRNQTSGNIVAISSDASRTPMRGSLMYCSTKAAMDMAIKCAARELAPSWRINGIAPSMVSDTNMSVEVEQQVQEVRGWTQEQAMQYELSLVPMGRRVTKQEVANLTHDVLQGPEFMTGSIIEIRGGK